MTPTPNTYYGTNDQKIGEKRTTQCQKSNSEVWLFSMTTGKIIRQRLYASKGKPNRKEEKKSIRDRESLEICSNPFFVLDRSEGCDLQGHEKKTKKRDLSHTSCQIPHDRPSKINKKAGEIIMYKKKCKN